jgi:hypothetical protein
MSLVDAVRSGDRCRRQVMSKTCLSLTAAVSSPAAAVGLVYHKEHPKREASATLALTRKARRGFNHRESFLIYVI